MKLAASLGYGLGPSEAVYAARRAEASGFGFIWVPESVDSDAFATLGAMASETSKIGLGTGIVNVYSRTPTQLAMATATMQELSSGRFVLGIGASSKGVVSSWHQVRFEDQLRRVEGCIDVLRRKLRPGLSKSHPPFSALREPVEIVVAGVLDRMVQLAKDKADGVLFFMRTARDVKKASASLGSSSFRVYANVVTCVSEDSGSAERRARRTVAYYLTYGDSYRRLILRNEDEKTRVAVAKVHEAWLAGRVEEASRLVPGELLADLALFGRPQECRRAIEGKYGSMRNLSMLGLQFNPGEGSVADSLRLFCAVAEGQKNAEASNRKSGGKSMKRMPHGANG